MIKIEKSQIRVIIAILLIVGSIAGLIFWEAWGRENILYQTIVVASKDIHRGDKISSTMLTTNAYPRDSIIKGSISTDDENSLIDHVANQNIPKNAQISKKYVYKDDFYIKKGESLFTVPKDWISSSSSTVRRGDVVEFWIDGAKYKIGKWKVAFVKAEDGVTEVTNVEGKAFEEEIERSNSSALVGHIEIICSIKDYKMLYEIATGQNYSLDGTEEGSVIAKQKFLLVQEVN